MYCPNCGAPMDDNTISCQYCGWENSGLVKSNNDEKLTNIYQRIFSMLNIADNAEKKAGVILKRVCVAIVLLFFVAMVLTTAYTLIAPKLSYRRQQSNLAKLEAVYETGDYEKLYTQLRKMGDAMYSDVYDKYYDIATTNQMLSSVEEGLENTMNLYGYFPEKMESYIKDDLYYPFYVLYKCRQAESLGFPHENRDGYENLSQRATTILSDYYCLDETEIEDGLCLFSDDGYNRPDFTELAVISAERISQKNK